MSFAYTIFLDLKATVITVIPNARSWRACVLIGAKGHHDRCTRDQSTKKRGKERERERERDLGAVAMVSLPPSLRLVLDFVRQIDDTDRSVSRAFTEYPEIRRADRVRVEENLLRTPDPSCRLFSAVNAQNARSFVRSV